VPDGARWSRNEHLLAFDLYCRTAFGRMHHRNPEVVSLARLLGRTPGSVALKLVNFARLDPSLKSRGIGGMSHGAKGEETIWREFVDDPEGLAVEAATLRGPLVDDPAEGEDVVPPIGRDALGMAKRRIGQRFFRTAVLAAYDDRCCVTGISIPSLLMASHIVGWADDSRHRTNPRNGLCLNALHDRAFDRLLMYFDDDRRIRFARHRFAADLHSDAGTEWLLSFEGQSMREPKRFLPDPEFLAIHKERALSSGVGG
jgi:putative restriction endonuclease